MSAGAWRRPLVVGASGQVGVELGYALESAGAEKVLRSSRTPKQNWLTLDLANLRTPEEAAAVLDEASPDLLL
ncbi:MAG: hypothetical protein INR62_06010 [Rhodospirillales bacterium]|nr:hypothetical protein [Acetobacter sp.]